MGRRRKGSVTVGARLPVMVVLACCGLTARAWGQAQEIRVDFGDKFDPTADVWNVIQAENATDLDLNDFNTGLGTGVSVTTASWSDEQFDSDLWTAGDKLWMDDGAGDDAFTDGSGSATITFDNLLGVLYRVAVVSSLDASGSQDISIAGSFADMNVNGTIGVDGDNFNPRNDGRNPGNWLIWTEVAPVSGQIVIDFAFNSGDASVNAVRLLEVPEPATGLIAALGAGALVASYRRRRRRR